MPRLGYIRLVGYVLAVVMVDGRAHTTLVEALPAVGSTLDLGFRAVVTGSRLLSDGSMLVAAVRVPDLWPAA